MTIAAAQAAVDEWIKTIGVRYFNELTNMACLTEEVGELARVMARKYGEQSFKAGENTDPSEEMADVLWVLICLANQTGVDLTEAFRKSLEKKTRRDTTRHLSNPKLHNRPPKPEKRLKTPEKALRKNFIKQPTNNYERTMPLPSPRRHRKSPRRPLPGSLWKV